MFHIVRHTVSTAWLTQRTRRLLPTEARLPATRALPTLTRSQPHAQNQNVPSPYRLRRQYTLNSSISLMGSPSMPSLRRNSCTASRQDGIM